MRERRPIGPDDRLAGISPASEEVIYKETENRKGKAMLGRYAQYILFRLGFLPLYFPGLRAWETARIMARRQDWPGKAWGIFWAALALAGLAGIPVAALYRKAYGFAACFALWELVWLINYRSLVKAQQGGDAPRG